MLMALCSAYWGAVAVISLAATVVESLPVNQMVDDNLSVPGVAAFLGILFLQVCGRRHVLWWARDVRGR